MKTRDQIIDGNRKSFRLVMWGLILTGVHAILGSGESLQFQVLPEFLGLLLMWKGILGLSETFQEEFTDSRSFGKTTWMAFALGWIVFLFLGYSSAISQLLYVLLDLFELIFFDKLLKDCNRALKTCGHEDEIQNLKKNRKIALRVMFFIILLAGIQAILTFAKMKWASLLTYTTITLLLFIKLYISMFFLRFSGQEFAPLQEEAPSYMSLDAIQQMRQESEEK